MPRATWDTILAPTRGMDHRVPSVMQDRRFSPNIRNMRLVDGVVAKRPGYMTFGKVKFGEPILHIDQFFTFNGNSRLMLFTPDVVYYYNTTTTGWVPINIGAQMEDCEDAWNEQVVANVTTETDTDRINGSTSAKLTVAAGFTTGIIATEAMGSTDFSAYDTVVLNIKSDVATSAGDIKFLIDDTADCASPLETLSIPALTAGQWTQVRLTIGTPGNLTAVISVGLQLDTDLGAQIIHIDDIWAVTVFTGADTDRWSTDIFNDNFYFTNGVNKVNEWTMTGQSTQPASISGTLTAAKVVRAHGSRLNAYHTTEGGTAVPQRHRYAAAGGDDFAAAGSGTGDFFEGADFIIDAVPLGPRLVVYKERSVNVQEHTGGAFIFRRDRTVNGIGPVSVNGVVDLGDEHVFVGPDNVYVYSGGRSIEPIGEPIRKEMFEIINDTNANRSWSFIIEEFNEVWFFIPTGTATWPDTVYVWNFLDNSWTRMDFSVEMSAVGYYERANTVTWDDLTGTWDEQTFRWNDRDLISLAPLTVMGDKNGNVYVLDPLTHGDNSVAISCTFETVDTPFTDDHTRRLERFLQMAFEGRGSTVDVYYSIDEGSTYTFLETVTLTGAWTRYLVNLDVTARKIRFKFFASSATANLEIRHFEVQHISRSIY